MTPSQHVFLGSGKLIVIPGEWVEQCGEYAQIGGPQWWMGWVDVLGRDTPWGTSE